MKIKLLYLVCFLTLTSFNKGVSKEKLYNVLIEKKVLFPEITLRIIYVETHFGKTARHNNLFGFRTKKGYLKFDSWESSIDYYKSWQDRKYPIHLEKYHKKSKCDYYCFLRSIGYVSGIKNSGKEYQYTKKLKNVKL